MNRMQIVVLGVSVAAFGGAYFLFNSGGPTPPAPIVQAAPKIETDEVLVAVQDVPMGTQIGDASVAWQVWPKAAISELMIAKSAGPNIMAEIKSARALVIQS
jgi:pilus assembly protein CpaB